MISYDLKKTKKVESTTIKQISSNIFQLVNKMYINKKGELEPGLEKLWCQTISIKKNVASSVLMSNKFQ